MNNNTPVQLNWNSRLLLPEENRVLEIGGGSCLSAGGKINSQNEDMEFSDVITKYISKLEEEEEEEEENNVVIKHICMMLEEEDEEDPENNDCFAAEESLILLSQQERTQQQQAEGEDEDEAAAVLECSKTRERGKRKTSLHLSLELLQSHFGKKLKDVAHELGIGRSTLKRACRDYGIDRWPTKEQYKKNTSLFQRESSRVYRSHANVIHVDEDEEKVMIKVKYDEDIVKFELCLSLGLAKLIEEVSTRLNLEKGAFKLKYLDEDGDEILLTNDADLQLCRKTQIAMNKTYIQLFVRL